MKVQSRIPMKIACIISITSFLTACAMGPTISVAQLSSEKYSPVAAAQVEVVTTTGQKRPYKEIAIIDVEEGPGPQSYDEMIQALRVRAGAVGAEAVIIDTSKRMAGAMMVGGTFMAIDGKFIKAMAVRWTDR